MKPWRENITPHADVLEGTLLQAEFAADITAVRLGKAPREYQDAAAFYERTFITEGMERLLTSVAKRLNGHVGDPVLQLQTGFGGGKTHTLLAVYHLARRQCPLSDLPGIPALLDQAGLLDVPKARVTILDGTAHAPGQAWRYDQQIIHTLWGELAWQLGGEAGYERVKDADLTGTSPGKEVLRSLLEAYAPCVILMDEVVAYIRQFTEGQVLSGGSYESNLSFIQALMEAVKLIPNAILLASLPESELEAGGSRGVTVLRTLEKSFGRIQALWKPVATEESFEIVRRRLFEGVRDAKVRDDVCRAFADAYIAEGAKMPSETQESRYYDRLTRAYPIHPEVFDRLYEDWSTLESFQRTRGVLKLMAKVIYRLWKDQNSDALILPGSLPLYDGDTRNDLTYYLNVGWDAVLERDIDGEQAETTELETREPRFGTVSAARRVARALFLGSAPAAGTDRKGTRGLDRARVLLGCLQPGQTSSIYSDALNRLSDRLHYLNSSGDKAQDTTRFWFDTRANLRREMEDRKARFGDRNEVKGKLVEVLRKLTGGLHLFDGVHIFSPHADVPDDSGLRLVFLVTEHFYSKPETRPATEAVLDMLRNHGTKPRYHANRLLFVAADHGALPRLYESLRIALAWNSIVDDVREGRLNIDRFQEQQARKELQTAEEVLPRVSRECYRWFLCPHLESPTDTEPLVEAFPLNTGGTPYGAEIERVCTENELVITAWAPIHLRNRLKEFYWKTDRPVAGAGAFWEDSQRYLYLPRLKNHAVLDKAVIAGSGVTDFFGIAYGWDGTTFEGFQLGKAIVQVDNVLLLVEPETARAFAEEQRKPPAEPPSKHLPGEDDGQLPYSYPPPSGAFPPPPGPTVSATPLKLFAAPCTFHGAVNINPAAAKMRLIELSDEIISLIVQDPSVALRLSVEITAEFPNGAVETLRRAISENASSLGFKIKEWE